MKLVTFIFCFISLFTLRSCKSQTNNPEVFIGFKMGSSKIQVASKRDELLRMNLIQIKDGLWVHTSTATGGMANKIYYATPIFNFPPGDTINSKITIVYFDDLKYTADIANKMVGIETNLPFNITNKIFGEVKVGDYVRRDILNELQKKYTKMSDSDTSVNAGIYQENYYWRNINGLNITLSYGVWKSDMIEAAGLRLEFVYTEEMRNKLFKKVSTY